MDKLIVTPYLWRAGEFRVSYFVIPLNLYALMLPPTTILSIFAASPSTVDPALVPPICAVLRTGSLKILGIGALSKPDQVLQVLKQVPHSTQIAELEFKLWFPQLELDLSLSDEVRPVP